VRVGIAFATLSVLLAALLAALAYSTLRSNAYALSQRNLEHVAVRAVSVLDQTLGERARDVELLAFSFGQASMNAPAEQRALLDKIHAQFEEYAWLGFAGPDGRVNVATGGVIEGADVAGRPWFQGGSKAAFFGDVHEAVLLAKVLVVPDDLLPVRFIDIAAPVHDAAGRFAGVLGVHLYLNWVRDVERTLLVPAERAAGIVVRVLDRDGVAVMRSADAGAVAGEAGDDLVAHADLTRNSAGGAGIRWRVEVRQSAAAALAPLRPAKQRMLAFSAAAVLLFGLAGWWLAGRLTRPILALAAGLHDVRRGRGGGLARAVPGARDEVAMLRRETVDLIEELVAQRDEAKMQSELREQAEARLTAAVRAGGVALWELDPAVGALSASSEWWAQLGDAAPAATVNLAEWTGRMHPDDRERVLREFSTGAKAGGVCELELRMRHRDGTWRWFLARAAGTAASPDAGVRLLGAQIDITERKRVEQRLAGVIENLSEGVVLATLDGTVLHFNGAALAMHGYPADTHPYPPRSEFFARFTLHDAAGAEVAPAQWPLARIIGGDDLTGYEARLTRRDGAWSRVFLYGGRRIREPGGQELALLTIADITARKAGEEALAQAEAQLRLMVDNAPVSIAMFDREMRYIAFSRRWVQERAAGDAHLLGRSHYEVCADMPAEWRERHRRLLAGERMAVDEELWVRADGRREWVRWAGLPWHDRNGMVGGVMLFSEDITDRKRDEEARLRSGKLEALGTLSRGVAHDFNNVLLAVRGYAALATDALPEQHPARAHLAAIELAGARARDLVRRILAFARQEEPQLRVQPIAPVIAEAVEMLRPALPAQVALRFDAADACPPVRADASQLHQVVVNLVMNAMHAIGDAPGTIAVSVAALADPQRVRLTVRDTGCGMDDHTLGRIFDPFFTTKPVGVGTGLGLSLVHGIVRAHGGSIGVESTPGHGTVFAIDLPTDEGDASSSDAPDSPGASTAAGRGERIVYVDDDESLVFLVKSWLTRMGYAVTEFTRPEDALAWLRDPSHRVDALVSDLSMPGMSGLKLAEAVLTLRPSLPVILTSGYISGEDEARARAVGVRRMIPKPDTLDELADALHAQLQAAQHEHP
jgi:PAS domain S-box-containing protein